jgi:hypothetical protein
MITTKALNISHYNANHATIMTHLAMPGKMTRALW